MFGVQALGSIRAVPRFLSVHDGIHTSWCLLVDNEKKHVWLED